MTKTDNTTAPMTPAQKQRLQQITSKLLHLARSVDDITMHALNGLATKINTGTQTTAKALKHFVDCHATHPNPSKVCRAGDMILNIHSDAAHSAAPQKPKVEQADLTWFRKIWTSCLCAINTKSFWKMGLEQVLCA